MKVFTTNHQHEDCYKYLQNCYKISSRYLKNIIKILKKCHQDFYKISCRYLQNIIKIFYKISPRQLQNNIKIVTKYHQVCYKISSQSSSDVPLPSPPWSIRSFDGLLFPKRDTSLQIWSQNTPGQKTYFVLKTLKKYYIIDIICM